MPYQNVTHFELVVGPLLRASLPVLDLGVCSFELALVLAFVCLTGDNFGVGNVLVEVFVAVFGFVMPVLMLSDFDEIVLLVSA